MNARYTNHPMPPYTYVTGHFPHPISGEGGHRCPGPEHLASPSFFDDWRNSATYLWAVDLFNSGFYWEAHEAWEVIWHDVRDRPSEANFIKGLIKLAAAGVKARERRPAGVERHAARAEELFEGVAEAVPAENHAGLNLSSLIETARAIQSAPPELEDEQISGAVSAILPCQLMLEDVAPIAPCEPTTPCEPDTACELDTPCEPVHPEESLPKMVTGWRRGLYFGLAGFFFVLAALGVMLPGLPTTPFLLLTSYFLVRTSPAINQRLLDSKIFGPILTDWQVHGGVRNDVKAKAVIAVLVVLGITAYLGRYSPTLLVIICGAVAMGIYVIVTLPTAQSED